MASRRIAPVFFLIASGLFFASALIDLLVRKSHTTGRPLTSASLGLVFLIVGLRGRSRNRAGVRQ